MSDKEITVEVKRRADSDFEQVVFGEVLVPDQLNVYGDYSTREMVRNCAYEFARQGYGLDVDHDRVDVKGTKYYVVESFIARDDDPDFIPGSWVVGVKIVDNDLWQRVLDGELNGFSFEAEVFFSEVDWGEQPGRTLVGYTEPHPLDGHTHTFVVVTDGDNRVISGGTGVTDGHSHPITRHTSTDVGNDHRHRFQILEGTQYDD